ncbi:hemolysin III [Alteromonadaceae bacterium Bs31]|nr:hemolysin III [Alteromonadaceae bacterium Bs31]
MPENEQVKIYSHLEEKTNIISHAIGFVLSLVALVLLVIHAVLHGGALSVVGFSIYGLSLMVLYAASTFYHSSKTAQVRSRLRVFDHASIYVLIAGSYTPFALVALGGSFGWLVFGLCWGLALIGVVLKLFFTGRYKIVSTLMYIFMGWMSLFLIKPLMVVLPAKGLSWLVAGGVAYTLGALIYSIKKIQFNHAIFHLFVLLGSFCHFISVYLYVLPSQ